ncbi:MAG: flagellar hook-basal body complex protein FliE [Idiomarinaceae bacterium HL-53]|nr:MAG: flagellar hook-basal body complex protein FliE [Idiomarinaceae bacterium HL-53]CUS48399.1 flagellar hook-basal body complex protein FliE [Idiomarinaceae bacterium HL-53]
MNVTNNPLMADMQAMLADMRASQQATSQQITPLPGQQVQPAELGNHARADFGAMLKGAIDNVNGLALETGELRTRMEMGDPNVSLAEVMISSQKSSIAFEAAVQVRNKVVEAYDKIMNMPV